MKVQPGNEYTNSINEYISVKGFKVNKGDSAW